MIINESACEIKNNHSVSDISESGTKKHIFYIDFLRSYATIMVVILHCIAEYIISPELYGTKSWYINIVLNSFVRTGVPIFFMISGYLLLSSEKTKDFKTFYRKKLVHIIVPLIFWNIVYFLYNGIMGYSDFSIKLFFTRFLNCGTHYHLWYLYTIIGIYLIAPFLKIIADNITMKQSAWFLFLLLLTTTLIPFVNFVTGMQIYLFEPLFNGYIACFFMGYVLSFLKPKPGVISVLNVSALICIVISVVTHNSSSSNEGINLILNSGYSLCHFVIAASVFVNSKFLLGNGKNTLFSKAISSLAKISFGIYLVHPLILDLISNNLMIDASPIVSSGYKFVLTIFLSSIVSYILGKIKYVKSIIS